MIQVAVVGAGHWGPNLINNFHISERSRVSWVVDRAKQRLAAVANRFPGVKTSTEFADVLSRGLSNANSGIVRTRNFSVK